MEIQIRRVRPEDAAELGRICYQAFRTISERHGFVPDFPSAEAGARAIARLASHPGFYGVVAEAEGRAIGSNFLDERSPIAGVGPITVDPAFQNQAAGRQLMEAVLGRAREKGFPGVRLVQATFHARSLALYTKLGFQVRELLACMQGACLRAATPADCVRPATEADLAACHRLCFTVHGHDRAGELLDGVQAGSARVVERAGRITGYASLLGFYGHAVGAGNEDLQALIASAREFQGPGILVPVRNTELFTWCLGQGLRVTQPLTLMTLGLYNEPRGAFLPSILY